MERLKKTDEGFTLLELIIAVALSAVVLLSASNLLINFGKFSANVVRSETSLMGTALVSFEEIVGKITAANQLTIPAATPPNSRITVRVDTNSPSTPSNFTDDTTYTYWLDAAVPTTDPVSYNLKRTGVSGDLVEGTIIARDISSLSFAVDSTNSNEITVTLEARTTGGATSGVTMEHLVTTAVMRSRSAN